MELRIPEDELRNAYATMAIQGGEVDYNKSLDNLQKYFMDDNWLSKYNFLEYFGDKLGIRILFDYYFPGNAAYWPEEKKIVYCNFNLSVIFHELSHAIHDTFRNLRSMALRDLEVVAEFCSYILCNHLGNNKNNFANMIYILGNTDNWHSVTEQSIDKAKAIIEQYSDDILRICNTAIQWLQEAGEQHS